ncbi:MAG: hypothetical protein A2Y63_05040 [Candidatus Riflebacteria bacterium RBG_13_59_9]|nr:MAG: hypothetical protein A2Y63_05040 [Candidatus Riflebacteria bacterium RBG_13_59_9]
MRVGITVYVLRSKLTGKRYVGITNDLPRRLREHQSKASKAGQLLGEFEVLRQEHFASHEAARSREKFLKSGQGRKWLDEQYGTGPARGG